MMFKQVSVVVGFGCWALSGIDWKRLGRLYPEDKVMIALSMSDFAVQVCAAGIKAQNPNMSRAELLEKLRERIEWSKRSRCCGV